MAFDSLEAFIAMGGYAPYVWLSFSFSLVVLVAITVMSKRKSRQIHHQVRQSLTREQRIHQAKEADLL